MLVIDEITDEVPDEEGWWEDDEDELADEDDALGIMPLEAELTAAEWISVGVDGTTAIEDDDETFERLDDVVLPVDELSELSEWVDMLRSSLALFTIHGCCITCSNERRWLGT